MSTGSSPFEFADFADATLRLPDSLRDYLRWPMGRLVHGEDILPAIGSASPVVTVGDFCTLDLVARGRTPDVCVVDFKTKRQEDPELREALQRIGSAIVLAVLVLRMRDWNDRELRLQFLGFVMVFCVVFNHRAERQSALIALCGMVIWYLASPSPR